MAPESIVLEKENTMSKPIPTLRLKKEIIRHLQPLELKKIKGGLTPTGPCLNFADIRLMEISRALRPELTLDGRPVGGDDWDGRWPSPENVRLPPCY